MFRALGPTFSTGLAPRPGESRVLTPQDYISELSDALAPDTTAYNALVLDAPESRAFSPFEEEILLGGGVPSQAGVHVSEHSALKIAAVFACCRVIAEDVAKMMRRLMRKEMGSDGRMRRAPAEDHPLYDVIGKRPNGWQTGYEFWEWMVFRAALAGDAYAYVTRDPSGAVRELLPIASGHVSSEIDHKWTVTYRLTGYGETVLLSPRQILRLSGPMSDEINAFAPVRMAREAIGLSMAIEAAQARFHANDLRPSGILGIDLSTTGDAAKSLEVIERIRSDWIKKYGPGGTGGLAILDRKFEFEAMTATSADSQTVENRKFQIEEICRFFRVHPQKIMHPSQAQSYGSVEQANISHVSDTLHPWVERVEQVIERDLIDPLNQADKNLYVHLNMNALARGTLGDRTSAYERLVKFALTPNEVRALEDMDPIDDPAADMIQFQANNTGLKPGMTEPPAKNNDADQAPRPQLPAPAPDMPEG